MLTFSAAPKVLQFSELVLSDRLLTLAEEADKAGFRSAAAHLARLACDVFDEMPGRALTRPSRTTVRQGRPLPLSRER